MTAPRWMVAFGLALVISSSCSSQPEIPPVDPDAAVASAAFIEALKARDVARLQDFFAQTILVVDTSFAGRSVKGTALSHEDLARWYAALFEKLGPSGWSAVMKNRRTELVRALHDGHHLSLTKTGDHVLGLVRPESNRLELGFEFVFRRISGQYKLVGQSEAFE